MKYWEDASNFPEWNVGDLTFKNAPKQKSRAHRLPREKPPPSTEKGRIRKSEAKAEAHQYSTAEDRM